MHSFSTKKTVAPFDHRFFLIVRPESNNHLKDIGIIIGFAFQDKHNISKSLLPGNACFRPCASPYESMKKSRSIGGLQPFIDQPDYQ
jgi:hypothetical protein